MRFIYTNLTCTMEPWKSKFQDCTTQAKLGDSATRGLHKLKLTLVSPYRLGQVTM